MNLAAIVDSVNEKHLKGKEDPDDTLRVTIGGSYDFGVVKPYISAAYFKDAKVKSWMDAYSHDQAMNAQLGLDFDGYGITLGASAPVMGGTFHAMVGYLDAESQKDYMDSKGADLTRYILGVGYEYPLSKRTLVYADAGYFKDEFDWSKYDWGDREPEGYQAAMGLVHYF